MNLVFTAILVHFILFISIFDIYFQSPITHGIQPIHNSVPTPAKRVVFIVADGLRASSFYGDVGKQQAPFLRRRLLKEANYGLSVTRLPTESRPGHVALLAGIYEDPSAVFKGWQHNPVSFDSLFNQTTVSYSWGSPDILNVFKTSGRPTAHFDSYHSSLQEFSGKNSSALQLNEWVIDKFTDFMQAYKQNATLEEQLQSTGVFFFLHLLGTDVAGHANKPDSKEYADNIAIADAISKNVTYAMEDLFPDSSTAYIFTSDHGMTNWGSHGAGSPDETETPIVTWGAGVECVTPEDCWRGSISQADIAPLLALVLGVSIPVNSVGVLPVQFLNWAPQDIVKALRLNLHQLVKQLRVKESQTFEHVLPLFRKPFDQFTPQQVEKIESAVSEIYVDENYKTMVGALYGHIRTCLDGIEYYNNYHQRVLLFSVTLSYVLWILVLGCHLITSSYYGRNRAFKKPKTKCFYYVLYFLVGIVNATLFVQQLPLTYYAYMNLPIGLAWQLYNSFHLDYIYIIMANRGTVVKLVLYVGAGIELLVFGFFERHFLVPLMGFLAIWPFLDRALKLRCRCHNLGKLAIRGWIMLCTFISVFPLLPVLGSVRLIPLVVAAGCLLISTGLVVILFTHNTVFYILTACAFACTLNVILVEYSFLGSNGLHTFNQAVSWIASGISICCARNNAPNLIDRLFRFTFAFINPLILMSVAHELLFPITAFILLLFWQTLEHICADRSVNLLHQIKYNVGPALFRRCFFYLVLVFYSFFGIGNIASINSFDVQWVRSFITTFSPFTMMLLILYKTVAPIMIVSAAFKCVNLISGSSEELSFVTILLYCNIMGLQFLYFVTNEGSWLDIGTSISHYVIVHALTLLLIILYGFCGFMISRVQKPIFSYLTGVFRYRIPKKD